MCTTTKAIVGYHIDRGELEAAAIIVKSNMTDDKWLQSFAERPRCEKLMIKARLRDQADSSRRQVNTQPCSTGQTATKSEKCRVRGRPTMLHVQITTQTIVHDVGGTLDRGELEAAATVIFEHD